MTSCSSDIPIDSLQELKRLGELAKLDVPLPISFPWNDVHTLNLTNCGLSTLPIGFEKAFPQLSILFLSNNQFQQVPEVIGKCPHLQMVAFKSNQLTSIHPEALQAQLRWLILTDNQITTIPDTIGRCTRLQKCMLSGNQIHTLPDTMAQCTNLELIRLASNQLKEPPMVLLRLPNLAWVALSDNPFLHSVFEARSTVLKVLEDLEESNDAEILGQGASGITRQYEYQGQMVAVKTYNTEINITSDGLPEEERRINCAAAGLNCSALIRVLGQTVNGSLVMELLQDFRAIGDPPSFVSCSRDVYSNDSLVHELTTERAISIMSALLQALVALHEQGICHGDFYGHNILVCATDLHQVRLSDFGAAFFYAKGSLYGTLLERIELRAFALFVEEVNTRLKDGESQLLRELVARCRKEQPSSEHNFDRVYIWWKQTQLADIAQEFGLGIDETVVEEKEPN
jgi:tRNA A-37 threonylcarbamoyl transferase component Bud32